MTVVFFLIVLMIFIGGYYFFQEEKDYSDYRKMETEMVQEFSKIDIKNSNS